MPVYLWGKIYYEKSDSLCAWDIEEKKEDIYVLHDAGKNRPTNPILGHTAASTEYDIRV